MNLTEVCYYFLASRCISFLVLLHGKIFTCALLTSLVRHFPLPGAESQGRQARWARSKNWILASCPSTLLLAGVAWSSSQFPVQISSSATLLKHFLPAIFLWAKFEKYFRFPVLSFGHESVLLAQLSSAQFQSFFHEQQWCQGEA